MIVGAATGLLSALDAVEPLALMARGWRDRLFWRDSVFQPIALGHISPSDRLHVAIIGTGGQGIVNIKKLLTHSDVKITAICDVARFWDNSDLYYRHNGGRGPAMKAIEEHYRQTGSEGHHGCKVYVTEPSER